jgi:hypothetical protein
MYSWQKRVVLCTFWAIFSKTHLATLAATLPKTIIFSLELFCGSAWKWWESKQKREDPGFAAQPEQTLKTAGFELSNINFFRIFYFPN